MPLNEMKFKERLSVSIIMSPFNRGVALWNTLSSTTLHARTMKLLF